MNEDVKIEAFDEDGNSVGVFESISKASRKLFIRHTYYISEYLNIPNKYQNGVKSYKTGKRYHFKIVK